MSFAPPASFQSGRFCFLARRSQSATSTAASASAVIGPMVVAWVANSILCQMASMQSASSPIRIGTRWSDRRRMTEDPPVPIV
ncbi:hypothetical protein D9M69_695550 [compost metagenome]